MRMMKGLKLFDVGKVGMDERPYPECGARDAIVRITAVCPCTTDVEIALKGTIPGIIGKFMGHEGVGIVEEIGSEVRDFKPGDRVMLPAMTPDWRCKETQQGIPQFSDGLGFYWGLRWDGVFAEYARVNDADMNAGHIPKELTDLQAVLLTDMGTTALFGVEQMQVELGDTVVVVGIGPVGLTGIAGLKARGAGRIFAVGSRPKCIEVAKAYGATDIINYKNGSIYEQIMDLNGGKQADAVLVTAATADAIADGLRLTRFGGELCNIACHQSDVVLPAEAIAWRKGMGHKKITGYAAVPGRYKIEKYAEFVKYGGYDPSLMVTQVLHGIEGTEEMFWLMANKGADVIKPATVIP